MSEADIFKKYEDLGKKWVKGEVEIKSFGNTILSPKQADLVNSKERFVLVCGGFAAGKTTGFIIKLWLLCMMFPGNRILLGRKTRADVESATLPDIIDIFPAGTYTHRVGPGIIEFPNGSEILFYGLDAMQSGNAQETKKAIQKIKGLNLGAIFIDQLEEIEYPVFEALTGRLRRDVPLQQVCMTTNPANFWAYDYFKANPRPYTRLIETSMIDNKANLKPEFIEEQLSKPKLYVRRYVYGEWSPDTLVEGTVFGEEYVNNLSNYIKAPLRTLDGIKIFEEPRVSKYQIGIDPSTGSVDPCHIAVVDINSGREVACYSGFVPTEVITEKAVQLGMMYSLKEKPMIVPEATGIGQALVESLKKVWDNIYIREVFNHRQQKKTQKLGFYTNFSTKTQLIEHFKTLLSKNFPKIYERETIDEMKTFIYTDEAAKKGAGAQSGYHDDRIMAKLLAYWNVEAIATPDDEYSENDFKLYEYNYN